MATTYTPGRTVTVTVRNGCTYTGTVVDGRYPHMYLTLDTVQGVLRIPLNRIED